jgi:3-hydroxyacyl-CoA dehydrogenase
LTLRIRKAVVIGSGVMGSGIAAHLANAGIETKLLDIVPEELTAEEKGKGWTAEDARYRNRLVLQAKERMMKQKPSPLFASSMLDRIRVGNIEDDLGRAVSEADWVVEAVTERLEVKKALFSRIEQHWRPGTIVSSNTSGISIERIAEGLSNEFAGHVMVTHFFNPPRYMKLLEMVMSSRTDPRLAEGMKQFAERVLGKGVVFAKDTPNFIANRIGTFGLMVTLEEMVRQGLSVSDVDSLTGPVIGRPKSATFRTLDLVGLDTFLHVAGNVREHVEDEKEKEVFTVPELLSELVASGRLGEKSGSGFYQAKRTEAGTEIEEWDYVNKQYVPVVKRKFAAIAAAKNAKSSAEKLRAAVYSEDNGGRFIWSALKRTLLYSAEKLGEIADRIEDLDDAMKWGFNWELGPFELWDAIGLERSIARMEKEGDTIPGWVKELLVEGRTAFYGQGDAGEKGQDAGGLSGKIGGQAERIKLAALRASGGVIRQNSGACLVDIGDDVACLEFRSPNNAIGPDVLQMIDTALEEVRANYRGLVIGNDGKNFCVGANLMMILMEAQDENWMDIERMIRKFHDVAMKMKYFEKPIVAAPFGMTLGGGVEMCLPASKVQAAAETYMGLVEFGVGVIPAGGGTKEMLVRHTVPVDFDGRVDLQPFVNRVFETIGMAKVSTSAHEAKELGYLRGDERDGVSINRDFQLADAKHAVLGMDLAGYKPPERVKVRVVGEPGLATMKLGVYQLRCGGQISDHDAKIAGKLAHVLAGGQVPANTVVREEYLLELEREAFLSLCGEPKSQARMQHMLLKGKPLRN